MATYGRGTLFLVVGNSGSGKDSVITEILKLWPSEKVPLRVARRYITRPPHDSEANIYVEPDVFDRLKNEGRFFLAWNIYGLNYGIDKEVCRWITEGINVVANVSRTIVPLARKKIPSAKVVFISVPFETTISRLKKRGREPITGNEIITRLNRAKENQSAPYADFVVENVGPLAQTVLILINYMLSVVSFQTCNGDNP